MWWSRKNRSERNARRQRWPLSLPLLSLSSDDDFTLADATEGVFISGTTGSGKTTGSGRYLACTYLRTGMGGLVLTAKSSECDLWKGYCRETGRLADFVVFAPTSSPRFNALNDELHRAGRESGLTENLVNLFSEIVQVAERQTGSGGREDEGYWRRAMRQLVRNCIDLLMLGPGHISFTDLYRVVISLPKSLEQAADEGWKENSFAYACLKQADVKTKDRERRHDLRLCADYVLEEFAALSEKTRSIVVSTFTSTVDTFQRGTLRELFSTTTNITPDAVADGKIIVMDLPVKEFREVGQLSQVLMKYVFMQAIERRPQDRDMRPVFLWCDEAQNFTSPYDFQFQTTARSARVCTVYLTQNISNLYATLGADEAGKASVDSLLANLNTKIIHANGDPVTNTWSADLIGRSRQFFVNANRSQSGNSAMAALFGCGGDSQTGGGVSEQMEHEVPPRRFTTLRKGGVANGGLVDAIVFQGGRRFKANGKTWLPVTFQQRL